METLANDSVAPANAANLAQVETPEPDGKAVETNGDGSAPSTPEARAPESPERDKNQERIDKLTREKYDALREADSHRYQIELMREQMARFEREDRAEAEKQATPSGPPTLESCGFDEAKFHAANHAYYTNLARETSAKTTEEAIRAAKEAERAQESQKSWKAKEAEFAKLKPDYFEKAYDRSLPFTDSIVKAAAESANGPAVIYHLANNRENLAVIAALPPINQALEIGRIVERLAKPVAVPSVSQAPPPPPKVESQAAATEKSPEDMIGATPTQFEKWRRKYMK